MINTIKKHVKWMKFRCIHRLSMPLFRALTMFMREARNAGNTPPISPIIKANAIASIIMRTLRVNLKASSEPKTPRPCASGFGDHISLPRWPVARDIGGLRRSKATEFPRRHGGRRGQCITVFPDTPVECIGDDTRWFPM